MLRTKPVSHSTPFHRATALLLFFVPLLAASSVMGQKLPSQDPGHKEDAEVAKLRFSVPKQFYVVQHSEPGIAIMRHEEYNLVLFIAIPGQRIDNRYLIDFSNLLAPQLYSAEKDYRWKVLPDTSGEKVSKYQTGSGNTKGFNEKRFIQTDYIVLKLHGRYVLVGYLTTLGLEGEGKYLFDLAGPSGISMPGWYAQAHVIASITGERYEKINPGTVLTGSPITGAPTKQRH